MSIGRWTALITILAATGAAVVYVRSATTTRTWQLQTTIHQQDELRQALWAAQTELAQLTAPALLRQKAQELQLYLQPPTLAEPVVSPRADTGGTDAADSRP